MKRLLTSLLLLALAAPAFGQGPQEPSSMAAWKKTWKGDASIVPVLRRWLDIVPPKGFKGETRRKLAAAIYGVAHFGDTTAVPTLGKYYRGRQLDKELREAAADALAIMGAKSCVKILTDIVWDQRLRLRVRSRAAEALVRLDQDLGRQFLLQQYDLYRLERKTKHAWSMDCVRDCLERLHDDKVIKGLKERLPKEDSRTMRNNITTLLARMKINVEPIKKLKEMAADTDMKTGAYKRYPAIKVLGERGGQDLIPFLEGLKPWQGLSGRYAELQNKFVKEAVEKAVARIRQRHWQGRPAGQPPAKRPRARDPEPVF